MAGTGGKRQPYLKLTDEQRDTIGRYAAEYGTVNTIRHFKGDFPKDRESFPTNNEDHATAKIFHREQFALYGISICSIIQRLFY